MSSRTNRTLSLLLAVAGLAGSTASAQSVYYDQPVLYHWGRYLALKQNGYRLVSVDVSGDLSNHRWAAVWEQRPGVPWIGDFGLSGTEFVQWRADRAAEGYRDQWITSAGSGSNRVFGAVMVQDGRSSAVHHDVSATTLEGLIDIYHELGWLMASASAHGTANDPRYAAVFVENPEGVRWGYSKHDTVSEYVEKLGVFVNQCWSRPAIVTTSASQRYLSVYHDDDVGLWIELHGATKSGYETTAAQLAGDGYRPIQIMVAGTGSAARYAALFAKGAPATDQMTITGTAVPQFAAIDELMVGAPGSRSGGFMQQNNAREAGIAITKNGRLVFARAYTWAKPGHPITQPTWNFRIASLSKSAAAMAAYHLASNDRGFDLDSRLVDLVDLGTPADPRANDIEVQHLIDHTSGYNGTWPRNVTDKLAHAQNEFNTQLLHSAPARPRSTRTPATRCSGWPSRSGPAGPIGGTSATTSSRRSASPGPI